MDNLHENTKLYPGIEDGAQFSSEDLARMDLLVDESTSAADLKLGIAVPLFQAGHDFNMERITLRVLDADLFRHSLHPVQLSEDFVGRLTHSNGVKAHVKDVVKQLLHNKQLAPIPYITRKSLTVKNSTYQFSTAIRRDFVKFVKRKFFNTQYLQRAQGFRHARSVGTIRSRLSDAASPGPGVTAHTQDTQNTRPSDAALQGPGVQVTPQDSVRTHVFLISATCMTHKYTHTIYIYIYVCIHIPYSIHTFLRQIH